MATTTQDPALSTSNELLTSGENPLNPLTDEAAAYLLSAHQTRMAELDREARIASLAEPTEDERRALRALTGTPDDDGADAEREARRRELLLGPSRRVWDAIQSDPLPGVGVHPPFPPDLILTAPVDSRFWWSHNKEYHYEPAFHIISGVSDGLHFTGGVHQPESNLIKRTTGVILYFTLSADRIPPSPSGRWASNPVLNLSGGLSGFSGSNSTWDHQWARCWLHLRHQIFQNTLGGLRSVGQADRHDLLIETEEWPHPVHARLPGQTPMPPLIVEINPTQPLVAELDVRFDVQVDGPAHIQADPTIVLGAPQWHLRPV